MMKDIYFVSSTIIICHEIVKNRRQIMKKIRV